MTDVQEIANSKIAEMVASGTIKEVIEKSVEGAITKAIQNEFESYGSITKQIKKAIEEGLQLNLKELPFETYNQQMGVAVKQRLGNLFASAASNKFAEEMDKLLEPAPKEINIDEFINEICGFWRSDDWDDRDSRDDYATVELEYRAGRSQKSCTLKIWKQLVDTSYRSRGNNQPTMQLFIINGKIRINHNYNYNPTCFSETEAYVFKLYAAGTVINGIADFDADDCNCDLSLREIMD